MAVVESEAIKNHAAFIWSVADLLRGDYKQSEYGRVILPLTVLRRLDCVLEPTKAQVLETAARLQGKVDNVSLVLEDAAGEQSYNMSKLGPAQDRRRRQRLLVALSHRHRGRHRRRERSQRRPERRA